MTLFKQALGEKEKLPFNWKKPHPELGSGKDSHLLLPAGGKGRETDGRELEMNNNWKECKVIKAHFYSTTLLPHFNYY